MTDSSEPAPNDHPGEDAPRADISGEGGGRAPAPLPPTSARANPAAPQSPPFQFGISSMLLITTLAAVVMSLSVMVRGIGMLLVIICTPALIRTYILVRRSRAAGKSASAAEKTMLFLACLGISALIALATGAAFFVTCLVGFVSGAQFAGNNGLATGSTVGIILGLLVAGALLIVLVRKWFKQPVRKETIGQQRPANLLLDGTLWSGQSARNNAIAAQQPDILPPSQVPHESDP